MKHTDTDATRPSEQAEVTDRSRPAIAVVEDDCELRSLIVQSLERDRFDAIACANGAELDQLLERQSVDSIVLDLMMPGEDGLSICRRITTTHRIPVIIVSARGDDIDRIVGLEIGADDYLAKPFNPRELTARLRAVLRRGTRAHEANDEEEAQGPAREIYEFDGWTLDVDARTLTDPSQRFVSLSGGEMALLIAFVRRPRRVLSREQLLDWTRSQDAAPYDRAIDVQLSRLRSKLGDHPREPKMIKTLRGEGYMFAPKVTVARAGSS